ncbi:hypothetical protein [Clostridium estertheticum]|uniref:hypothetical protein n=1 Tax=Clostridium estertheticum TaxID=238834 RepID=UPI001C7E0CD7|nr:hypothetical protein [Clostridium estertheticum]MBX4266513.1 hypothetical protein [Clostridium estertheticum]WLC88146.1 hypothetical protein KTC95_19330 [Clostridium estertheticum]
MFNKKEFSIPVSKYLQIIKTDYVYLQIKPYKTKNYDSTNIAKAIQGTYQAINKRIKIEYKQWLFLKLPPYNLEFKSNFKISYCVDIKKENTNFYFIVPKMFLNIIIEKIREIWSKVELDVVDPIEKFSNETVFYQVNYKKEDALSLKVDKKSSEPLNSILSVMEIMQDADRVTLVYNFLPKSQFNWIKKYKETRKKIDNSEQVIKDRTTFRYKIGAGLSVLNYIGNSIQNVLKDFLGDDKDVNTVFSELLITSNILETNKRLSDNTLRKKDKIVLDAQILIAASSHDIERNDQNIQSVCQAFKRTDEEGGNELIAKPVKLKKKDHINIEDYKFKRVMENTFSVDECQNFIQQPSRDLMKTLGISHVAVTAMPVPKELTHGYVSTGKVKCKNGTQNSYLQDNYDKGSLPLVPVGAQGAGKSKFIANYYKFVNKRKEGGVVIDFIKNCELSDDIIKDIPPEDLIVLDYTNPRDIQSLCFNEYEVDPGMNAFDRLDLMNRQAQQILNFVNAINIEQPLQARMRKYLSAATNIVFATGESSFKEVIKCLEDYKIRASYIEKLSDEEIVFLEDEIKSLLDLDDYSKASAKEPTPYIIGTKVDRISGILDRISLLKEDFKLKYMFNKSSKNNINFAKELEKGKIIVIKMRQDKFTTHSKNVITTFLLSKVWIATEIRGSLNLQPKPTHICVDEIFQTKTAMQMLANQDILEQTRKFGCKFLLSCQFLQQIELINSTLEGAGASYMLLGGTSEKDFKHFENKLDDFEYSDLRDMPQYSSLNLIYYSGGYASYISKLPSPIRKRRRLKLIKLNKAA